MTQGPVQIAEPGVGFQMSPFGILPIGVSVAPPSDEYAPAAAPARQVEPLRTVPAVALASAVPAQLSATPTDATSIAPPRLSGPRDVVRAAKARAKEIRAQLKAHEALKRELAELERLIKAAKQKPEPKVRALRAG